MGGFLLENWLNMNFRGGQLSKVVAMATCVMNHGTKDGWISFREVVVHEFSGGQLSKAVAMATCVMNHSKGWVDFYYMGGYCKHDIMNVMRRLPNLMGSTYG